MNTIEIKNLNKKIKGAEVLKDINLHLEGGKVYGLKGKNGSGKTTLLNILAALDRQARRGYAACPMRPANRGGPEWRDAQKNPVRQRLHHKWYTDSDSDSA